MAERDPKAWKISSKMEPNYEGGLIHNDFIEATLFIKLSRAQRNGIPALSRSLGGDHTTLCYVRGEGIYELINNPVGDSTTDGDWELMPTASADGSIKPIGNWDISNLNPVLQDTDAAGINGQFYYVTGAPTQQDVTHAGLFLGTTQQLINEDWVMSVGTHWIRVRNTTTWDTLNKPQSIIDYENGIVIGHIHSIGDITGLQAALDAKWDDGNLADMVLDFVDVPDSGISNVAFLRKHFYDKTQTYTRDEINALLSGLSLGDPTFDGERAIRKIPVVGENTQTTALGATVEEMFYGFIKPVETLQPFAVQEVGDNVTPTINGSVDPKDAEVISGNVVIKDELDGTALSVAAAVPPAITNFNQAGAAKTIAAGLAQSYKVTYTYKKTATDPDVNVVGETVFLKGVYPFLTGMAATGLTGANIYSTLTKLVQDKGSQTFSFTGTDQRIYIAIPQAYGAPVSIQDQSGNELIGSLFPASPSVLAVDSSGLTVDWSGINYNVYESQYDVTMNGSEFVVYFDQELSGITDLDDIAEGTVNKHFTQVYKDKLDDITTPGADIGDMKEADFISHYEGIIDHAAELAILGWNDSGAPIAAGSYVKYTGWNATEGLSTWATADKDNNDDVNGFVEAIITNGSSGRIILKGENRLIDTSGQVPGTRVYLGATGGVLFSPPVSGSLVQIGVVEYQANPGIVASRELRNLVLDQYVAEFRPNTSYPEFGVCAYNDPEQGLILLRAKTAFTSGGSINLNDWDPLGADMKRTVYDVDDNGIVDESTVTVVEVYNGTGLTITKGTLVKFSGFNAIVSKPTILAADQSSNEEAVGIVLEDIATVTSGKIVVRGIVKGVDTTGMTVGDRLYLSTAGGYTITKPTDGYIQEIGRVTRVDAADGEILIILDEKEVETIEQIVENAFVITGGNVVKTVMGYNTINQLTQVVDYTLPLISGLTTTKYLIHVKNGSGGTINLLTNNPDTLEGDSSVQMLDGESFTLYINNGYKIL